MAIIETYVVYTEANVGALRPDQLALLDPERLIRVVEDLTEYQVYSLLPTVENVALIAALLEHYPDQISVEQMNTWLVRGFVPDPEHLSVEHFQSFHGGDSDPIVDQAQINYLLDNKTGRLSRVNPARIREEISVEQANRFFPQYNDQNAVRLPLLNPAIVRYLVELDGRL